MDSRKVATEFYHQFNMIEHPLLDDYPLTSSWWPSILMSMGYLVSVKLSSNYMAKRNKEFNVKAAMVIYNFLMVFWSGYMFLGFLYYGLGSGMTIGCWPVDYKRNDKWAKGLAVIFYHYFISKFVEYLDTWFFIARKRFELVSVLHVYHHAVMSATTWLAVRYSPGSFITLPFMANCFVHTWMYTYYGLAALGPGYRKYLFWKKHMTTLQIVQFILVLIHSISVWRSDCNCVKSLLYPIIGNAFIFLVLFLNFYFQAYKKKAEITKTIGTKIEIVPDQHMASVSSKDYIVKKDI